MGADCLWITFARGYLWWTFAEPEVFWISDDLNVAGERMRKSIGGWRNTDINGVTLDVHTLSTKLTKVANYRRTICAVEAQDYLLRRINGIVEPIVTQSIEARNALLEVTTKALTLLDWSDFETLVDIIFSRMGWNRMSRLGGAQALVDLELELPIINEYAAVQVKSAADQSLLDDYIERVDATQRFDRFFFICHSPKGALKTPVDRTDIQVWTGQELASTVVKLGLQDWVIEKIA